MAAAAVTPGRGAAGKSAGFSLAELLVAIAIGMGITSVLIAVQGAVLQSKSTTLRRVVAGNALSTAMKTLAQDLREASTVESPGPGNSSGDYLLFWRNVEPGNTAARLLSEEDYGYVVYCRDNSERLLRYRGQSSPPSLASCQNAAGAPDIIVGMGNRLRVRGGSFNRPTGRRLLQATLNVDLVAEANSNTVLESAQESTEFQIPP